MIITVASAKGGCGKTTTAVHLAAYFQKLAPTLLLDGDETRNATEWSQQGDGFPFKVADQNEAAMLAGKFAHTIIDTGQKPNDADLDALSRGCHLLIIPTVPAGLDTLGLVQTITILKDRGRSNFRVLLTKVPPAPEQDGPQLRTQLKQMGIPVFKASIPRLKAFDKAYYAGVPVREVDDPRSERAWKAYADVGKEIGNG
jgi:chromosome partitioning protein